MPAGGNPNDFLALHWASMDMGRAFVFQLLKASDAENLREFSSMKTLHGALFE